MHFILEKIKLKTEKIVSYILSSKFKIFIFTFILGLIFVFPFLQPHFSLDSYTLVESGYLEYIGNFLKSARLVSSFMYVIFDLIKMPFSSLTIISTVLSVLFLSFSVIKFYNIIVEKLEIKKNIIKNKIIIYFSTFLIFFNFCNQELFTFCESFVMCFGIYLIVNSVIFFMKGNKKDYIISLLLLMGAVYCYQGVLCVYISLILFLMIIGKEYKFSKLFVKRIALTLVFYLLTMLVSFLTIKVITTYFINTNNIKIDGIDIFYNIKFILSAILDTMKNLYGLFSAKVFYCMLFLILILLFALRKQLSSNKIWVFILILIITCIIFPFIPNIFMTSTSNYTASRMSMSIGMIISILIIIIVCEFKMENIKGMFLVAILSIYFIYSGFICVRNLNIGIQSYSKDLSYVNNIEYYIEEYELNIKKEIKKIYYARNNNVNYHYGKIPNSFNYRIQAIDWAFMGAMNGLNDRNYEFVEMNYENKEKYFNNVLFLESFNVNQLVFMGNELYLLLY